MRLPRWRNGEWLAVAGPAALLACSHAPGNRPPGSGGGGQGGEYGGQVTAAPPPDRTCAEATVPAVDVLTKSGELDADAYVKVANALSTPLGIQYRYGPDASCWHTTQSAYPGAYRPMDRVCPVSGNYGDGFLYQVGPDTCTEDPSDYSSTQGALLYVADDAADVGVEQAQILAMGHMVFISKPRESWTYGIYSTYPASDAWKALNGGAVVTGPVAAARSFEPPSGGELNMNALVAFNDGFIGAWGENTANNGWAMKLPEHKVPTGISITNGSEFALVTVWDTAALRGQVAVIALDSAQKGLWSYAFAKPYPGFQNCGNYTFGKLLGFIDLPEMRAPTEISAVSNRVQSWWTKDGANKGPADFDFSNEADRQTFVSGENKGRYSTAGFAAVISRSERKVAFLDLQPLFAYYAKMYFGTQADFASTQDVGQAPSQWPFDFSVAPESQPVVVTTLDTGDIPTAVLGNLYGDADASKYYGALVATINGHLDIYDVGGLLDESAADAAKVRKIGSVAVGHNPTKLTYRKGHAWSPPDPVTGNPDDVMKNEVFVVARGDREIELVRITGSTGSIVRRIVDAALVDPIAAEDAANHGTESYLLTVADYGGRQFVNYRFGPIVYHTNGGARFGMGADGKAELELGGTYAVPGRAFFVSGANVP